MRIATLICAGFRLLLAGLLLALPVQTVSAESTGKENAGKQGAGKDKVLKIDWDDLIPKDVTDETIEELMQKNATIDEDSDTIFYNPKTFPIVKTLNGKTVRIPGYVVPLDMELNEIKEFLLVPYFGACIHVPPPPPNQIIYVKTKTPLKLKGLDYAVEVTGRLSTQIKESGIANTGYTLDSKAIAPYAE